MEKDTKKNDPKIEDLHAKETSNEDQAKVKGGALPERLKRN